MTENEMILTFLQAELYSPRFANKYNLDLHLIYKPDLTSERDNKARLKALTKVRGFGNRTKLFKNFPKKINYSESYFYLNSLNYFQYLNHPDWNRFSDKTRFLHVGVGNLFAKYYPGITDGVFDCMKNIVKGVAYPLPIVATDGNGFYIVEGHTRLTAHGFMKMGCKCIVMEGSLGRWKNQRI